MTQYLLSVFGNEAKFAAVKEDEMQEMFKDVGAFNEKLEANSQMVFAGGLMGETTATVVHPKDGKTTVTDGPYLESKEFISGFWIIEAADLDEALELAKQGALACKGEVEVRPFQAGPEA